MNPNKIFRIFVGYLSFVIFGGVLLSFKLLADFSNCEQSTPNQAIHPHETGRVHIDPWNVNDHPVSYAHGQTYNKEKRDVVKFQPQPLIIPYEGLYLFLFKCVHSIAYINFNIS